jgi:alpha-L-fucosidase 2
MYKLGCVSRKGAPAITLQAIWTADNGNLPPWKGDFHNDLNTQLSYWPCYTGNHLTEAAVYTDWLWRIKAENKKFTQQYFGVPGLAVPGVTTLNGVAMGGWIQYSLSPSTASWLAQHFYWQWKYSMDNNFLVQKAYPYLHEAAVFIEQITYLENGQRQIALSSSPEYHDNSIHAWFTHYTNYDLSLYKFALSAAAEAATALHKNTEAQHWQMLLHQLPQFDVNETGLTIAPGQNLDESHRHHAQLMAIYPLAQLNADDNAQKKIIDASLQQLQAKGTRNWCGYSFSWAACIYARAKQADSAVKQLQIFTSNFCSPNSFHLNGDQKGGEYSSFTYRPFTLEGNFAFAQGVHELLLQSKQQYIDVFPAIPASWKDVSFTNLRVEGAFIISAAKENGVAANVKIFAEKGGVLHIKLPFATWVIDKPNRLQPVTVKNGIVTLTMQKGQTIIFTNGYE